MTNKMVGTQLNMAVAMFCVLALAVAAVNCKATAAQTPTVESANAGSAIEDSSSTNPKAELQFSSRVLSIFQDSQGRLWFGSHREGLALFNGRHFKYFTVQQGLADNQVRDIQEDSDGVIWLATGNGITSYQADGFKIHSGVRKTELQMNTKRAWKFSSDELWFHGDDSLRKVGDGQSVYKYDGRQLQNLPLPVPENADPQNPYLVTSIAKGKNGNTWISTYPGVFRFDGQSFELLDAKALGVETSDLHIRCVFEDSQGKLWIGNNGIGVLCYDGKATLNFSQLHGVSPKQTEAERALGRVFSIAEDSSGNIWFGTSVNGVWRYDGSTLKNFTIQDGLTSNQVFKIYRDRQDQLWFGMGDGAVCQFNGKTFEKVY